MHDPTEHAQEHVTHEAAHGHGPPWITAAALTAALLAAFAAITAFLATSHLTESTLKRIDSNDQWLQYDSDSVKRTNIYTREEIWATATPEQRAALKKRHDDDQDKLAEYNRDPKAEPDPAKPQGMKAIGLQAEEMKEISRQHLETHETFEMAATMFHIAIAVVAIAVVAKRKEFWYMSMVGGVVGLGFFGYAFAHAPHEASEKPEPEAAHAAAEKPGDHPPAGDHAATAATAPGHE